MAYVNFISIKLENIFNYSTTVHSLRRKIKQYRYIEGFKKMKVLTCHLATPSLQVVTTDNSLMCIHQGILYLQRKRKERNREKEERWEGVIFTELGWYCSFCSVAYFFHTQLSHRHLILYFVSTGGQYLLT